MLIVSFCQDVDLRCEIRFSVEYLHLNLHSPEIAIPIAKRNGANTPRATSALHIAAVTLAEVTSSSPLSRRSRFRTCRVHAMVRNENEQ
mgnify:CR=1 FL=1